MISNKMQESIVHFIITVCFFYIEALLHYNIGKHGTFKLSFPKFKENLLIFLIIVLFSCFSSMTSYCVINYFL